MNPAARLSPFLLAAVAGLSAASPVLAAGDHAALAQRFLEAFERGDATPETFDFEEFLAHDFVQVQLGLFDVYLPLPSLADKDACEKFQRVAQGLVDAQERWLEWLAPEGEEAKAIAAETKAVAGWVKSWKLAKWEWSDGGSRQALDLSGVKDDVRALAASFAERMGRGTTLGLEREPLREPLILIPERGRFVEAIAFAGWLRPDLQSAFWKDDIHTWTNFYLERYKVLATAYASPGGSADDYAASMDMSARTPTGLEQQVVQLAMNSLIDNYYGSKVPPTFAGGLSINLVVDLFEECNTRADGDLSERRTDAIEIFVPGGNPGGGVLGTIGADSRWRDGQGGDRFVKVLRAAQKSGASEMKQKKDLRFFELRNAAGSEKKVLAAPFLGSAAAAREELPAAFAGDQLEFLRAYRCAFLWWLQNESLGKAKPSNAAFAAFLRKVAHIEGVEELEPVFQECFEGAPLSSGELDQKTDLEGRFLVWLSKKK